MQSIIVTKTELYMPVTLGYSDASMTSNEWEVVYDLEGNPTGMEVLEIGVRRLNLSRGDRSSDDGYSEVTRNRVTSMQSFTDDARNVVEFDES